jgi:hypothetical protein
LHVSDKNPPKIETLIQLNQPQFNTNTKSITTMKNNQKESIHVEEKEKIIIFS